VRAVRYRSSVETSHDILAIIAQHKEYAQYDLCSAIKKDYRTVLRHVKHLKRRNLIHLRRSEPASKGGKDRNIYGLTFQGLIAVLKRPQFWLHSENVDDIAGKYTAHLPLVFGKWELYEQHDFKEQIVARMHFVLTDRTLLDPLTATVATQYTPGYITEQVLTSFPESNVFYRLLTISARDPELRRFFDQHMEKLERTYAVRLTTIHEWMATWDAIKDA